MAPNNPNNDFLPGTIGGENCCGTSAGTAKPSLSGNVNGQSEQPSSYHARLIFSIYHHDDVSVLPANRRNISEWYCQATATL